MKKQTKRILCSVLAFVMIFGMLSPALNLFSELGLQASAVEAEEKSIHEMLKFDVNAPSLGEEGENPYGPGAIVWNPEMELLTLSNGTIQMSNSAYQRLYNRTASTVTGNNLFRSSNGISSSSYTLRGATANHNTAYSSASVAADLDGSGKPEYLVRLCRDFNGAYFCLRIYKNNSGVLSNLVKQIDLGKLELSFEGWNLRSYLSVTAGDYDGDGEDEIAVYAPKDTVIIYDLHNLTVKVIGKYNIPSQIFGLDAEEFSSYTKGPAVQLSSCNIDNDRTDDLVITANFPHNSEEGTQYREAHTAIISYVGGTDKEDTDTDERWKSFGVIKSDGAYYGSTAAGDFDCDGVDELVFSGMNSTLTEIKMKIIDYNEEEKICKTIYNSGFMAFSGFCSGFDSTKERSPVSLICFNPRGLGFADYIFVNGTVYEYKNNSITTLYSIKGVEITGEEPVIGEWNGWIESVAAGNFLGDSTGKEQIVFAARMDVYAGYFVQISLDSNNSWEAYSTKNQKIAPRYRTTRCNVEVLAIDTDNDTMRFKYVDKDYYFSDPKIVAVLQAAPHFSDLAAADNKETGQDTNYAVNGSTVYGQSSGSGESSTHGFNVTSSLTVGFEQEVSVFMVKLGSVSVESELSSSVGAEWTNTTEVSYSTEYSSASDDDRVILTMTPYIRYNYEIWTPEITLPANEAELEAEVAKKDKELQESYRADLLAKIKEVEAKTNIEGSGWGATVGGEWVTYVYCVPQTPRMTMMTVTDFDKVAAATGEFETIRGEDGIFNHTVGVPSSYSSSSENLFAFCGGKNVVDSNDPDGFTRVSRGGGSVTQSIEWKDTNEKTLTWGTGVSVEASATICGVKAAVGVSSEYTGSSTKMNYTSTYIAGTVAGIPVTETDNTAEYDFRWQFGSWIGKYSDKDYCLVLGYLVKDVTEPHGFPKGLSAKDATANSVTLNWSPCSSEYVEIFMVTENETNPYFKIGSVNGGETEYTVEGLSPNTKYTFALRATDESGSKASLYSPTISEMTRALPGDRVPAVADISDVYTIAGGKVSFAVNAKAVDGGGVLNYQWQELFLENHAYSWKNLKAEKASTLELGTVDASYDQKVYRCEVSQLVDGEVVYVYTNNITVHVGEGATSTTLTLDKNYGTVESSYQTTEEQTAIVTEEVNFIATIGETTYKVALLGEDYLLVSDDTDAVIINKIKDDTDGTVKSAIATAYENGDESVALSENTSLEEYEPGEDETIEYLIFEKETEVEETVTVTKTVAGEPVTLTATVTSLTEGIVCTPKGQVRFTIVKNDETENTSENILISFSGGSGNEVQVDTVWTPSKAGTYTITATYLGQEELLKSSSSESASYDAYEIKGNTEETVKSFVLNCDENAINGVAVDLAPVLKTTTVEYSENDITDVQTSFVAIDAKITYSVSMLHAEAPAGSYTIENNSFTATEDGTYVVTASYTDEDNNTYSYTKNIEVATVLYEQQPIAFQNSVMTVYTDQTTVENQLINYNYGSTVTYEVSPAEVASVDANGVITILSSGTAKITATSTLNNAEPVTASFKLNVIKIPVEISVPDNIEVTYGQSTQEAIDIIKASGVIVKMNGAVVENMSFADITGVENDAPVYTTNYKEGSFVGRYTVNIAPVESAKYDVVIDSNGYIFNVVHKTIGTDDIESVTVEAKEYDGTTDTKLTATFKDGVILENDAVTAEVTGTFDTSDAGENKLVSYELTGLSGANSSNYKLAENITGTSTGTINKAPITVTLPKTTSVVYDGEIKSVNVLAYSNGLYYNDFTVKYVDENNEITEEPINVGVYKIIVELDDEENYDIKNSIDASLVIKSATQDVFTVEGIPETAAYGDVFEIQTAGAQSGSEITYEVSGIDANGNPSDIAELEVADGKTYLKITGTGTVTIKATSTLENYTDKTAIKSFTAGKKILGVRVTPVERVYDGTTIVEIHVELEGLLAGDEDITATANGVLATADAGKSKTVFVNDITLSDNSKYQPAIISTQVNVDIEKLEITGFEITAKDKVYDGTTAAETAITEIRGVLDADKEHVNINGSAEFDTKDRGENKTVTFTATGLSGNLSANYKLAETAKTATCTANIIAASSKDFYISGHHSNVSVGEQFVLRAYFDNRVADAVWSSSNENVATVDAQTGRVTITGAGSAVIYAGIDEGYGVASAEFVINASGKNVLTPYIDEIGLKLEELKESRVTIYHNDEIEKLKAEIDELLADGAITDSQITALNEYKAQCDKLLTIIHSPEKYISFRFFWLIVDTFRWMLGIR